MTATDGQTKQAAGFFQEDNGHKSSMRLMCFTSLIASVLFGFLTILLAGTGSNPGAEGVYITFGFLLGAFAPKAVQKFAETKISPPPPKKS